MSTTKELPALVSWCIEAVQRIGFERVLILGLLYALAAVGYAEQRSTHVDVLESGKAILVAVDQHAKDAHRQLEVVWGMCLNAADDDDVEIARCGARP